MKTIFMILFGFAAITSTITHVWTVYIALTESGILAGILTFIMPVLSNIYWVYQMYGVNDAYVYTAIATVVLATPLALLENK